MVFIYNKTLWFVIFLFFVGDILTAQTFTDRIKEERTYKTGKATSIEINNKYGKIHVIPWKKDSVKIETELFVSSNNLSRLERTKNSIRFDFTATNYYITASTNFGSGSNQFLQELRGLSGNIIPGTGSVEINYIVHCPLDVNLSIINKFGNIYIDDLKGELKISLSNGDLKINSHTGQSQIELNFGTGIINSLSEAKLSVSYSDIRIRKAERLTLDAKSSTVNIDDCNILRSTSRRDKFFITNVHSLTASGFFSQYWIESIEYEADAQLKFGSFHINMLPQGFNNLNINSEYADLNISLDKSANYEMDIFYNPDVSLHFPGNIKEKESQVSTEDPALRHIHYTGGNQGKKAFLRIYALQKCFININEK